VNKKILRFWLPFPSTLIEAPVFDGRHGIMHNLTLVPSHILIFFSAATFVIQSTEHDLQRQSPKHARGRDGQKRVQIGVDNHDAKFCQPNYEGRHRYILCGHNERRDKSVESSLLVGGQERLGGKYQKGKHAKQRRDKHENPRDLPLSFCFASSVNYNRDGNRQPMKYEHAKHVTLQNVGKCHDSR
jgi:hypothetical protein